MKLTILMFGITRDIIGHSSMVYEVPEQATVPDLVEQLKKNYPSLQEIRSLLVAVNNEYGQKNQVLQESDEIALIPPVSGG